VTIVIRILLEADRKGNLFIVEVDYLIKTKHDIDHIELKDMSAIIRVYVLPEYEFIGAFLHDLTRCAGADKLGYIVVSFNPGVN
jgi:hypothetical protein